jgi:hypothetical protein
MSKPHPPSGARTRSSSRPKSSRSASSSKRRQPSERSVFADTSAPFGQSSLGFPKFFRGGAVPPRKMVVLPYSSSQTLTAGGSSLFGTELIYRLNSIYDPLYSGAGDYPNGYSAWSNFYADYRVHRVGIDLTFTDPSADGMAVGALVQYSNATSGIAASTIQTADSQQKADIRPLNNTGSQTVRISRTFNIWDLDGNTRLQWLANPGYQAVFGQNPTLCPYIRIAAACFTSATPTVSVLVRLTYYVELFDRIDLTG